MKWPLINRAPQAETEVESLTRQLAKQKRLAEVARDGMRLAGEAIAEAEKQATRWRLMAQAKAAKIARLEEAIAGQAELVSQLRAEINGLRDRLDVADLKKLPLTAWGHLGIARPVDANPRYVPVFDPIADELRQEAARKRDDDGLGDGE